MSASSLIVENRYTSCACNKTTHCLDWGKNGLICYGSANSLVFCEMQNIIRVIGTISAHSSRVNCVRWIRNTKENILISASSDKTACVWEIEYNKNIIAKKFEILSDHGSSVNICEGIYDEILGLFIVTYSADFSLRIWNKTNKGLCLASGCDDNKIHLFYFLNNQFSFLANLTGHEDWIRSIDFHLDNNGDILLLSSSQDLFLRIWRISYKDELNIDVDNEIQQNQVYYSTKTEPSLTYGISIDSVLFGHDNWVYSAKWFQSSITSKLCIVSASMDKTVVIWQQDGENGLWIENARLGEVGGNTLGFYGCVSSPNGKFLLAHGFRGAFHMWTLDSEVKQWKSLPTIGGHYDIVEDICWESKSGSFLLSVSKDQTTRLHGIWRHGAIESWNELGRPQIHGYDIKCIAMLSSFTFASGADEKIIRIFNSPKNTISNLESLCDIQFSEEFKSDLQPEGAAVPALGLSNKSVFTISETSSLSGMKDKKAESYFSPLNLIEPPTEEDLLQNTLWPESNKLYGHGYEIFALAARRDGKILASSCKATKFEFAFVILWDTTTWQQIQNLFHHSLTVTDISFSHDGNKLLLVSRDRLWSIFTNNSENQYVLTASTNKTTAIHSRIIWCCSWSHDDCLFVTGSRDKKVIIWCGNKYQLIDKSLQLNDSITAIDFAPGFINNSYLTAIGLDDGEIYLYLFKINESWKLLTSLNQNEAHSLSVKRIRFKPKIDKEKNISFASCSTDQSVKIFEIRNEVKLIDET